MMYKAVKRSHVMLVIGADSPSEPVCRHVTLEQSECTHNIMSSFAVRPTATFSDLVAPKPFAKSTGKVLQSATDFWAQVAKKARQADAAESAPRAVPSAASALVPPAESAHAPAQAAPSRCW